MCPRPGIAGLLLVGVYVGAAGEAEQILGGIRLSPRINLTCIPQAWALDTSPVVS